MIFFGRRKKVEMKKNGPQRGVKLQPLDIIDGFKVRPGWSGSGAKRRQLYDSFIGGDELYAAFIPAAGEGTLCEVKISGGISYRKYLFHAGIRSENRRI